MSKVNPVKALTSGKFTANDIGKTVYLSNSASTCQEWIIAGLNHDNTSGTVDLISKYVMYDSSTIIINNTSGSSRKYHMYFGDNIGYEKSLIRTHFNDRYYNSFANEIKELIKTQNTACNISEVYQDKVKLPSLTELGCRVSYKQYTSGSHGYNLIDSVSDSYSEGTVYPLFDIGQTGPNQNAIGMKSNGTAVNSYTRSQHIDHNTIYAISSSGVASLSVPPTDTTTYPRAIIRF